MKEEFLPCYQIATSRGDKIIVKGNLDQWVESTKGMKWRHNKIQERVLYAGRYRCTVKELSPSTMMTLMAIFIDENYRPIAR